METSIENYKKLKKKYFSQLVEKDIKTEQKVMENKENELKFLLKLNDMRQVSKDANAIRINE
jgi:hypothetical protein